MRQRFRMACSEVLTCRAFWRCASPFVRAVVRIQYAIVFRCVLLIAPFSSLLVVQGQTSGEDRIEFNRDVRPILSSACFTCHGPDASQRKADLRLDHREAVFSERDGKPVLVPGDPLHSQLFVRITSTDPDQRMPPPDSGHSLNTGQVELLRRWIEQGAEWQTHWSFLPPQNPSVPRLDDAGWARNPIDYFILQRMKNAGLDPSPMADRRTLIRRLSLDLRGLPPTPQEVAAFLADDTSSAWEKLIDRLLDTPAYGERMALNWLDAARYADTHGYHEDYHRDMWPWRDWVINAFNSNMPFDQFTIEQLAGDMLPDRSPAQIVATGFNRNHGVTASGISEEYRVEYVLDRVRTTSTVWMGLTMHCAQCHDHKYDPISQEEFYRFFAYFNSITDKGVENRAGNVDPLLNVESPDLAAQLADLEQRVSRLEQARQQRDAAVPAEAVDVWENQLPVKDDVTTIPQPNDLLFHYPLDAARDGQVVNAVGTTGHGMIRGSVNWTTGRIAGALNCDGKAFVDLGDTADFERSDAFSCGAWITSKGDGAVIARIDDTGARRGWDLLVSGGRVEVHMIHHKPADAIHVRTKETLEPTQWTHVFVTYDGSGRASGVRIYLNGVGQPVDVIHDALTGSIRTNWHLHIGRRNSSTYFPGVIDDVRIYGRSLTAAEVSTLAQTNPAAAILATARQDRTEKQQQSLRQYYLRNHDTEYGRLNTRLESLREREKEIRKESAKLTVMVMQEMDTPRSTFLLKRGAYDQHGQMVQPGTPNFLSKLPDDAAPTRLALAQWLIDPAHPLTSRVTVNRLWQMVFGTGIVKTSEDFGTQGELPSHPELLDWLATEFIRSGWDVKQTIKLIVMSATYRQSSRIPAAALARDPENRLLSRGARFRLPAELVRDNALAASGLLVEQIGGPSVKPYQPAGLWKETSNRGYEQGHGADLYRRSLYTYWKRSVPPPNMFAIDAPTRETCIVRRQRTNTPLMALVMLNDPTFVEAARALAERAMTDSTEVPSRIALMFERATSRQPNDEESDVLLSFYHRQHKVFAQDKEAATRFLTVGESKRDEDLDVAEHAALTTVASIVLNMDETITKE